MRRSSHFAMNSARTPNVRGTRSLPRAWFGRSKSGLSRYSATSVPSKIARKSGSFSGCRVDRESCRRVNFTTDAGNPYKHDARRKVLWHRTVAKNLNAIRLSKVRNRGVAVAIFKPHQDRRQMRRRMALNASGILIQADASQERKKSGAGPRGPGALIQCG